ncbi:MAG: DUF4007 family protein [Eubacteriales bacterium]
MELQKKVRLKANESFNFREGWLRKGMRCVGEDPRLFSRSDAMITLGIGSKMVKSLKFWLQATHLCQEHKGTRENPSRTLEITDDFGAIIEQYDPYFDDSFTLCLLHYHLVKNWKFAMVWHLFFNEFTATSFTKENMVTMCTEILNKKMETGAEFSEKSFASDCSSVLAMYLADLEENDDPEDNLKCPLAQLGLLQRNPKPAQGYHRTPPQLEDLSPQALLYVMVSNLAPDRNSVSFDSLLNAPNQIGKLFHLDRILLNEYLDQLRVQNYVSLQRTANLNMVNLRHELTPEKIMRDYYENQAG